MSNLVLSQFIFCGFSHKKTGETHTSLTGRWQESQDRGVDKAPTQTSKVFGRRVFDFFPIACSLGDRAGGIFLERAENFLA